MVNIMLTLGGDDGQRQLGDRAQGRAGPSSLAWEGPGGIPRTTGNLYEDKGTGRGRINGGGGRMAPRNNWMIPSIHVTQDRFLTRGDDTWHIRDDERTSPSQGGLLRRRPRESGSRGGAREDGKGERARRGG
jgi:hypothetical protein